MVLVMVGYRVNKLINLFLKYDLKLSQPKFRHVADLTIYG